MTHRHALPQLSDAFFLTDGGLETTLVFLEGVDLPCFAAFDVLKKETGKDLLRDYYARYAAIAQARGLGFILESPTWRANPDWAEKIGYTSNELAGFNQASIALMAELRKRFETPATPYVISGCVGPRGDGYDPGRVMTAREAEAYHGRQIQTFADTDADLVTAITMTNCPEAIGVVRAAQRARMPAVISFTVETDGKLPTGQPLGQAIEQVDRETDGGPAYYMINCAHPTHFAQALSPDAPWIGRLRGLRANASRQSHAELDEATELDMGDPAELGVQHADLLKAFPNFRVLGGCCGTDHRHVEQISLACAGTH